MTEVDRLKPCPWCAGAAELHQPNPDRRGFVVRCRSCGVFTRLCRTAKAAAARWNALRCDVNPRWLEEVMRRG